jgi:hypothetical protein
MSKKQMTAEQLVEEIRATLKYYMNDGWGGYRELLSIARGEGGMFNNDWEAAAFHTCHELIMLLGLSPESEEDEDGEECEVEVEEDDNE